VPSSGVVGQAVVEDVVPEMVLIVAEPEEVDEAAAEEAASEELEEELELELDLTTTEEELLVALAETTEDEEVLMLLVLVVFTELDVVVVESPHWIPQNMQLNQL
jgi:hypothetical protein